MVVTINMKYVVNRGHGFEFRLSVPQDLREHLGKTAITESLHEKDERKVQKIAEAKAKDWKAAFKKARTAMEQGGVCSQLPQKIIGKTPDLVNVEHEIHRLSNDLAGMENHELNTLYHRLANIQHSLKWALERELTVDSLEKIDLSPVLGQTLLELCQDQAGVKDLLDGVLRRKTARFVIPKLYDMLEAINGQIPPLLGKAVSPNTETRLVNGRWLEVEKSPAVPVSPKTTPPEKENPLLSDVLTKYLLLGNPVESSGKALRDAVSLLVEWLGDRAVSEYSEDDLVDYRNNCLRKLPTNWKKKYKGKSIHEVVKQSNSCNRSITTINNLLRRVGTIFAHAVKRRWIDVNPASGLNETHPKLSIIPDKSYSDDELKKLFDVLQYDAKTPSRYPHRVDEFKNLES